MGMELGNMSHSANFEDDLSSTIKKPAFLENYKISSIRNNGIINLISKCLSPIGNKYKNHYTNKNILHGIYKSTIFTVKMTFYQEDGKFWIIFHRKVTDVMVKVSISRS
ncbi:hypothetical protein BpHYR1_053239 [Brachionus plicatilis]|uniref:Uncharacterized protein n=1 Tax=Brachionus plicatilis TaxID=10195 RepID=A0A3M7SHT4_BRAPC|nr:hypothetical protein BpHYR1_053239 [Brachionus plicatilis]